MSDESERFCFVHMQKTAGTSLYLQMRQRFGASAMYPSGIGTEVGAEAVLDIGNLQRAFAARRSEIRVVTGHFPLCISELLDAEFRTFTVLRDPVERILSSLRHRKQRAGTHEVSLEETYAEPLRLHGLLVNHMVKMLAITPEEMTSGAMTFIELDERHLERAKQALVDRIEVFGFAEQYDALLSDLSRRFGWDLGPALHARQTDPEPVSDDFRAQIARDSCLDVELYEFARALRNERNG